MFFNIFNSINSGMHLRYYLDKDGKRVYTMKTVLEDGRYTLNAHPGLINFFNYHFFKLLSKNK